jgi:hypothetical protein
VLGKAFLLVAPRHVAIDRHDIVKAVVRRAVAAQRGALEGRRAAA